MREPWERYLNDVVSHVRFAFDRRKIRQELAEHMEDLYEDLLSQDIDEEQAAELTVDYMGAVSYTHLTLPTTSRV